VVVFEPLANTFDGARDLSAELFVPPEPSDGGAAPERPSVDDARERYDRLTRCAGSEDYVDYACMRRVFREAYARAPQYKLLYNLGLVMAQLGHFGEAHALLQAYLDRGGSKVVADRRREVRLEIDRLEQKTSWLFIRCEATVGRVDLDSEYDTSSLAPCPASVRVRVAQGPHTIEARAKDRFAAAKHTVIVGASAAGVWIR
jgi:hypothetical protein